MLNFQHWQYIYTNRLAFSLKILYICIHGNFAQEAKPQVHLLPEKQLTTTTYFYRFFTGTPDGEAIYIYCKIPEPTTLKRKPKAYSAPRYHIR